MFWRGPKTDEGSSTATEARLFAELIAAVDGQLACTQVGCADKRGFGCQYVDRRGRACATAWCPQHRRIVSRWVLCRRHAGVIRALSDVWSSGISMPDLNNRAPSLVHWVASLIDTDVRALLEAEVQGAGGQIATDPVTLTFVGRDRRRNWEQAWKLLDHTGLTLRAALAVQEEDDSTLIVKVNSNVLGEMVPPWIYRGASVSGPPVDDEERRLEFNQQVLELIRQGLDRERAMAMWAGPRPLYWPS